MATRKINEGSSMYFRYAVQRKACLIQQNHFTFRLFLLLFFLRSLFLWSEYAKKKSPSKILLLATKSNQHRQRYTRQLNIPIIFHKQHFYSDIYTKWLIIGLYPGLRRKLREREKNLEKLEVVCICIGLSCCGCFVFFYVIIGPNWWISINTRCLEFCYLILKMELWVNTVKAPSNEHKRTWSEFGLILEQLLRLEYIFFSSSLNLAILLVRMSNVTHWFIYHAIFIHPKNAKEIETQLLLFGILTRFTVQSLCFCVYIS